MDIKYFQVPLKTPSRDLTWQLHKDGGIKETDIKKKMSEWSWTSLLLVSSTGKAPETLVT